MYMKTPPQNIEIFDMPCEVNRKKLESREGRTRYHVQQRYSDTQKGRKSWQRSYAYFTMIQLMVIRNPIPGTIFPKSIAIRTVRLFQRQNRSISSPAHCSAAYPAIWACANTSNPTATHWL